MSQGTSLLAELKRRNVFRVGLFYLVSAWLIIQVAETVLPLFDVPASALRALIVILALGFPLALVFSWIFELTPGGIRREKDVEVTSATKQQTAHKLNIATLVAVVLGIGIVVADRILPDTESAGDSPAMLDTPTEPSAAIDKSIAVLPFSDFSPGGDSQWFADGLSEEILNSLIRVPDLLVAARTSSFSFRDSGLPIPEIADALGVAHLLEGSVRMTEERIRVTAQLIRAADGFQVWSNSFDRETADMIEIQEELAGQISTAMETTMDPEALAAMAEAGTRSVEAYSLYLRARARDDTVSAETYALYEQVRELDPQFAAAHYRAAEYWQHQLNPTLGFRTELEMSPAEMRARFDDRISAAIETAGNPVDAVRYRAALAHSQLRLTEALQLLERYVSERPNDFDAWESLRWTAYRVGDMALMERARPVLSERAFNDLRVARRFTTGAHLFPNAEAALEVSLALIDQWPDNWILLAYQAHRSLLWMGRIEDARRLQDRLDQELADRVEFRITVVRQACAEGRIADALTMLEAAPKDIELTMHWIIADLMSRPDQAIEALRDVEVRYGVHGLVPFLGYAQFDARPFPSLIRIMEREGIEIREPQPVPFACPPAESVQ
jgi:TolB-like protein